MNKQEIASYLASLSQLMKDQDAAGGIARSAALASDYNYHWGELKRLIQEDQDERSERLLSKDRTKLKSSEPGRSSADRPSNVETGDAALPRPRV